MSQTIDPASPATDQEQLRQLHTENLRLQRALAAVYARRVDWLGKYKVAGSTLRNFRVGLFDLSARRGPYVVTVYDNGRALVPLIRVGRARHWAERILRSQPAETADQETPDRCALSRAARDVLQYLGARNL